LIAIVAGLGLESPGFALGIEPRRHRIPGAIFRAFGEDIRSGVLAGDDTRAALAGVDGAGDLFGLLADLALGDRAAPAGVERLGFLHLGVGFVGFLLLLALRDRADAAE
jgi:hypothetical protein